MLLAVFGVFVCTVFATRVVRLYRRIVLDKIDLGKKCRRPIRDPTRIFSARSHARGETRAT